MADHKHKWMVMEPLSEGDHIFHALPTTENFEDHEIQVGHELSTRCVCQPVIERICAHKVLALHRCLIPGHCPTAENQLQAN